MPESIKFAIVHQFSNKLIHKSINCKSKKCSSPSMVQVINCFSPSIFLGINCASESVFQCINYKSINFMSKRAQVHLFYRALTAQVHPFSIALMERFLQVSNSSIHESINFGKTWLNCIIEVTIRPLIEANMAWIT